jgi:hypothetical protein
MAQSGPTDFARKLPLVAGEADSISPLGFRPECEIDLVHALIRKCDNFHFCRDAPNQSDSGRHVLHWHQVLIPW